MVETIIKMTGGVIRQQKNTILKNVNVEIQSGEFVYLIGKVGSGKSSFLKTLYAELPLEYGTAEVAGFKLKKIRKSQVPLLRRKCGIVFQDFKLLTDRNVYDNLEFVLRATGWKNRKAIRERIENVLSKVGMLDKQKQMPHQLSGGEQQRIVLARALLNAPPLILADEPTGNIDPETSYRLVELLKEICDTGKTVIIATHQYDLIGRYPGRVLCCENGELFEKSPAAGCECVEETVVLPEVEEILPEEETGENVSADVSEDNRPEIESAISEDTPPEGDEAETGTIVMTEIAGEALDADSGEVLPEKETIEGVTGYTEEGEQEEDVLTLIGKLDYPEITAFDYELEQLPEIQPEEESRQEETVAGEPVTSGNEEIPVEPLAGENPEEEPADSTKKTNPPAMDLELID